MEVINMSIVFKDIKLEEVTKIVLIQNRNGWKNVL